MDITLNNQRLNQDSAALDLLFDWLKARLAIRRVSGTCLRIYRTYIYEIYDDPTSLVRFTVWNVSSTGSDSTVTPSGRLGKMITAYYFSGTNIDLIGESIIKRIACG